MSEFGGSGRTSRRPRDGLITSFAGIRRENTRSLQRDASRGGGTARGTRDANRSLVSTPSVQRQMNTPSARLGIDFLGQEFNQRQLQGFKLARQRRLAMDLTTFHGSESWNSVPSRDNGSVRSHGQPQPAEPHAPRSPSSRSAPTPDSRRTGTTRRGPATALPEEYLSSRPSRGSPRTGTRSLLEEEKYPSSRPSRGPGRDYDEVQPTAAVPRSGTRKPVDPFERTIIDPAGPARPLHRRISKGRPFDPHAETATRGVFDVGSRSGWSNHEAMFDTDAQAPLRPRRRRPSIAREAGEGPYGISHSRTPAPAKEGRRAGSSPHVWIADTDHTSAADKAERPTNDFANQIQMQSSPLSQWRGLESAADALVSDSSSDDGMLASGTQNAGSSPPGLLSGTSGSESDSSTEYDSASSSPAALQSDSTEDDSDERAQVRRESAKRRAKRKAEWKRREAAVSEPDPTRATRKGKELARPGRRTQKDRRRRRKQVANFVKVALHGKGQAKNSHFAKPGSGAKLSNEVVKGKQVQKYAEKSSGACVDKLRNLLTTYRVMHILNPPPEAKVITLEQEAKLQKDVISLARQICPSEPERTGLPKPLRSGFDPINALASPGGTLGVERNPVSLRLQGTPWAAGNGLAVPVAGDTATSKTSAARAKRAIEKERRDAEFHQSTRAAFCVEFNEELYPRNCRLESPNRLEERIFVWSVLEWVYPAEHFDGVRLHDVATAWTKIQIATFNDTPEAADNAVLKLLTYVMPKGHPFSKAMKEIKDFMRQVESTSTYSLGATAALRQKTAKDRIMHMLKNNSDYAQVLIDCKSFDWELDELIQQCQTRDRELKQSEQAEKAKSAADKHPPASGDTSSSSRAIKRKAAKARKKAAKAEKAAKARSASHASKGEANGLLTKEVKAWVAKEGFDPRTSSSGEPTPSFLTPEDRDAYSKDGLCFMHQALGRCRYGDSCKYKHVDANGKEEKNILTSVPSNYTCRFCKAKGKHWSGDCESKPKRGERAQRATEITEPASSIQGQAGPMICLDSHVWEALDSGVHCVAYTACTSRDMSGDSGASRSMFGLLDSFVDLHWHAQPFKIEVANGQHIFAHFSGTARVEMRGADGKWHQVVVQNALWTPDIAGDLLSIGRLTFDLYQVRIHGGVMHIDRRKEGKEWVEMLAIESENFVFPITTRASERTNAEVSQIAETVLKGRYHGHVEAKIVRKYERLATESAKRATVVSIAQELHTSEANMRDQKAAPAVAKEIGADAVPPAEFTDNPALGQGFLNHCRFGHIAGAAARMGLPDIAPGTCPHCNISKMQHLKSADDGHRVAEFCMQYLLVDVQGPFITSVLGDEYWTGVVCAHCSMWLGYAHPTLKLGLTQLDALIRQQTNKQNTNVEMLFRAERRGELRVPDVETEAKGAAGDLRHTFDSLAAHPNYVELSKEPYGPAPPTPRSIGPGTVRVDGAGGFRGHTMSKIMHNLGAKKESPAAHMSRDMGGVEVTHSHVLMGRDPDDRRQHAVQNVELRFRVVPGRAQRDPGSR